MNDLPPESKEWLKTAKHCNVCWPLADAMKAMETKGYDRGPVDFKERTVPPYPMTPEQRAIRVVASAQQEEPVVASVQQEFLAPAAEYPLETIIKRNKNGAINTQSTVGKVVSLATEKGCEMKVGGIWLAKGDEPYERHLWLQGAHHGLRFKINGANVWMNGRLLFPRIEDGKKVAPVDQLLREIEKIGAVA